MSMFVNHGQVYEQAGVRKVIFLTFYEKKIPFSDFQTRAAAKASENEAKVEA